MGFWLVRRSFRALVDYLLARRVLVVRQYRKCRL